MLIFKTPKLSSKNSLKTYNIFLYKKAETRIKFFINSKWIMNLIKKPLYFDFYFFLVSLVYFLFWVKKALKLIRFWKIPPFLLSITRDK